MCEENKNDIISLVTETDDTDYKAVAEEMAKSISKMYEDRDKKAENAKSHLVSQLEVTSDKYRTANGVMSALAVVRDVWKNNDDVIDEIAIAKTMATKMAVVASSMADKASVLDPEKMDNLCKDFYDDDFSLGDSSALDMIEELMKLQLCQNVGPNAEDIVEFIRHADEEIEKARENLKKFCEENDIDFNELCGPYGDCHDCLCEDCEKDCKDHKIIKEGQSAYDVCENFAEKE